MERSPAAMWWVGDLVASKVLVRRMVHQVPIRVEKSPMTDWLEPLAKDIPEEIQAHLEEPETEVLRIENWLKRSSTV